MEELRDLLSRPLSDVSSTSSDGRASLTPHKKSVLYGNISASHDGRTFYRVGTSADMTFLHPCTLRPAKSSSKVPIMKMTQGDTSRWEERHGFGGYTLTAVPGQLAWIRYMLLSEAIALTDLGIYDSVFLSMFKYRHSDPILMAFASRWSFSTNTAILDDREMTPTLLEISSLTGLPIYGKAYMERRFSTEEVFGRMAREKDFPAELREIYHIYEVLLDDRSRVLLADWVAHFTDVVISSDLEFARPSDPFGDGHVSIYASRDVPKLSTICSREYSHLTVRTGFFAWWICYFLLPGSRPGFIRPSVFRIAYKMAKGDIYSLAVSVLCFIYTSLRMLTTSRDLSHSDHQTPVHLLSGWLSMHIPQLYAGWIPYELEAQITPLIRLAGVTPRDFSHVEAQFLFIDPVRFLDYRFTRELIDVHQAEAFEVEDTPDGFMTSDLFDFLVSIRSGFLPLRIGGRYIMEYYPPQRCSWQHGYDQAVPVDEDTLFDRPIHTEDFYERLDHLFRSETGFVFTVPSRDYSPRFYVLHQKKHMDFYGASLCSRDARNLVSDSVLLIRDTRLPFDPPTFVQSSTPDERPSGFRGWDSYYHTSHLGTSIPRVTHRIPPEIEELPSPESPALNVGPDLAPRPVITFSLPPSRHMPGYAGAHTFVDALIADVPDVEAEHATVTHMPSPVLTPASMETESQTHMRDVLSSGVSDLVDGSVVAAPEACMVPSSSVPTSAVPASGGVFKSKSRKRRERTKAKCMRMAAELAKAQEAVGGASAPS